MASTPITDFTFKAILKELVNSAIGNVRVTKTKLKILRSTAPTTLGSTPKNSPTPAVPAVTCDATTATGTRISFYMTLSNPSPINQPPVILLDQGLDARWKYLKELSLR